MGIPRESDLAAIRRTQAEPGKPHNRSAIDFYSRNSDQIIKLMKQNEMMSNPTARMNEFIKRVSTLPTGIDPKIMTGLGLANYGTPLMDRHASALQQILSTHLATQAGVSLDSIKVNFSQIATSSATANLVTSLRGMTVYDKGACDSVVRAMPNLAAVIAVLPKATPPIGILESTRSALGNFDLATLGLQAQLSTNANLISKMYALNLGLPTANLLSAQIELEANKLARSGVDRWSQLPAGSIAGLAGLSSLPPVAGASALDLMSVARGVYGVISFASRAAETSISGTEPGTEPDEMVEDWASSSLAQDLRRALTELHPALAAKLEGAWEVYRTRGPDALGQAATSLVELIDRSMDILAPTAEVEQYAAEQSYTSARYFTDKGNPTVALKLRYVMRARPLTADALDAQVTALTKARKSLQGSKHNLDFSDDLLIGRLLLTVESVFTVILLG